MSVRLGGGMAHVPFWLQLVRLVAVALTILLFWAMASTEGAEPHDITPQTVAPAVPFEGGTHG